MKEFAGALEEWLGRPHDLDSACSNNWKEKVRKEVIKGLNQHSGTNRDKWTKEDLLQLARESMKAYGSKHKDLTKADVKRLAHETMKEVSRHTCVKLSGCGCGCVGGGSVSVWVCTGVWMWVCCSSFM